MSWPGPNAIRLRIPPFDASTSSATAKGEFKGLKYQKIPSVPLFQRGEVTVSVKELSQEYRNFSIFV